MSDSRKIKKTPFWLLNYSNGTNPFSEEPLIDDLMHDDDEAIDLYGWPTPDDERRVSQFDTAEEDRGER